MLRRGYVGWEKRILIVIRICKGNKKLIIITLIMKLLLRRKVLKITIKQAKTQNNHYKKAQNSYKKAQKLSKHNSQNNYPAYANHNQ